MVIIIARSKKLASEKTGCNLKPVYDPKYNNSE